MTTVLNWWASLSARERVLIVIMLTLLVPIFIWFALWKPALSAKSAAQSRLASAVEASRGTQTQLVRLKSSTAPKISLPLAETVTRTAAEAGFDLSSSTESDGNRLRVEISSARAAALLNWLATLERLGITAENVNISTKSDATLGVSLLFRHAGT